MNSIMIRFDNVHFHYNRQKRWAVNDVSLDIGAGEFLGIVGRSGAGKSTLCMCISGLIPNFEDGFFKGTVTVDGIQTNLSTVGELSKVVGMIFQNPESQLYGLTVEEEISFALENHGLPVDEIRQRIKWALNTVELNVPLAKSPFDLSGGQKQRLIIASTLALSPKVLVLDEPTAELDPAGKDAIYAVLQRLHQEGKTIVMVDHDIERLAAISDRIAILDKGKLITVKPPSQLFNEDYLMLQELGLRLPQVFEVFQRLAITEEGKLPITLDVATVIFQKMGFIHV